MEISRTLKRLAKGIALTAFVTCATHLYAQAVDTDGDGWSDADETALGTNPNDKASFPKPGEWAAEVAKSAPKYWWRFEGATITIGVTNQGASKGAFDGSFGADITDTDLGKTSAAPGLGKAMEFTGPASGNGTGKFVDFGAEIPELINLRDDMQEKSTTVEYWIKSGQVGTSGSQTWTSPSLFARESGGDGDMYWGWFSADSFGFSTSDITEIYSLRDGPKKVNDDKWHHIVLIKEWSLTGPSTSTMYIDGGGRVAGVTIVKTTAAGAASFQDADAGIQFLGFTQNGGGGDVQYIGLLDEVAIYDRKLSESEVRLHYSSVVKDTDGDGMSDEYELANGLNSNLNDAQLDPDNDGLPNLGEYQRGTKLNQADSDSDGFNDGVESNTRNFVSATNTGTDPLNPDSDGDGLKDGVETGTGTYVSATNTGTNPLITDTDADSIRDNVENNSGRFVSATDPGTDPNKKDSDGDGFDDAGEIAIGSNPTDKASIPKPGTWVQELTKSAPRYWWRFEETDPTRPADNAGAQTGFDGTFGPGITAAELGKTSVLASAVGKAIEFTGPAEGTGTEKFVDFGAPIPELIDKRSAPENKSTTVEYWIQTSQTGSTANQTWTSPSIFARESGGDGDMYWGWINATGEFGFSTSDLVEILSQRDGARDVTDGQWHHIVLVKEWKLSEPSRSLMYIDGGASEGGATILRTTAAGAPSLQDDDGEIQFLGYVQSGGGSDVQFIGLLDEVAIYNRALTEAEVRLHFTAVTKTDTDGDGIPDMFETANNLNPNLASDAALDPDSDGATNLQEYQRKSNLAVADTDGDGVQDGPETATGVYVSATDRGTSPVDTDSDDDGLTDGTETNTGTNPTNPTKPDTDGDGFSDGDEVALATNPSSATSKPVIAADWVSAVRADAPLYFWRFEETNATNGTENLGSATGFDGKYGAGIVNTNLGKPSASSGLGNALEFTGPPANNTTTKFVDFGASIPELINLRSDPHDKATTVEYWIKTEHRGTTANQTWTSPSIFARESGGDGDMYWGWMNQAGQFGFSTSDITEIFSNGVVDNKWHHVMMVKIWKETEPSISRMFVDGGAINGGRTFHVTTPAGAPSQQDDDGAIQFLGFVESGGGNDLQYIGFIDEVAIYNKALLEANAWAHYKAAGIPGQGGIVITSIVRGQGTVTITWTGTGTLQEAAALTGNQAWNDVSPQPTGNTYTTPTSGGMKFFRFRQ